jgi:hypothetical protein
MAQKAVVELTDDLDGTAATETVSFGLDGVEYTIDVHAENAAALRKAFAPWQEHARRIGGRTARAASAGDGAPTDPKAVRAWATQQGIELSARGRIPANVIEKYRYAVS